MISCAVTVPLICVFVFAYEKSLFSHDAAHLSIVKSVFDPFLTGTYAIRHKFSNFHLIFKMQIGMKMK